MIKTLKKLRLEGMYLNIIKAINDKPIANIILQEGNAMISSEVKNESREPILPTE
jgi:hypothetical protein